MIYQSQGNCSTESEKLKGKKNLLSQYLKTLLDFSLLDAVQ